MIFTEFQGRVSKISTFLIVETDSTSAMSLHYTRKYVKCLYLYVTNRLMALNI